MRQFDVAGVELERARTVHVGMLRLVLIVALLLAGCASPVNDFAALTSKGELLSDGGGECGAVAVDATHAITAAHCVRDGAVYYHPPGTAEGRRVKSWRMLDVRDVDVACLEVATGEAGSAVAELVAGAGVVLDGNVSGAVAGRTLERWRGEALLADLPSRNGDSGSAVRDELGDVVGLLSLGYGGDSERAPQSFVVRASNAVELCR